MSSANQRQRPIRCTGNVGRHAGSVSKHARHHWRRERICPLRGLWQHRCGKDPPSMCCNGLTMTTAWLAKVVIGKPADVLLFS